MLLARTERLCRKYLMVSMNFTRSDIFAKFILVKFLPPNTRFLVLQAPNLRPFKKKKKSKTKRLCATTLIWFLFSLTFRLQNYAHTQQLHLLCANDESQSPLLGFLCYLKSFQKWRHLLCCQSVKNPSHAHKQILLFYRIFVLFFGDRSFLCLDYFKFLDSFGQVLGIVTILTICLKQIFELC